MNKICKRVVLTCVICATLSASVKATQTNNEPVNYMEQIIQSATNYDYTQGNEITNARNDKIISEDLEYAQFTFDDFMLVAKIVQAEAGSAWLSQEWKMCVGEVVLNRVASPEFPNTIKEVLEQKGQYYGKNSTYFNNIKPSIESVNATARLFNGERILNNKSVVFQANFKQGSGVHMNFYDKHLGNTYFCYSNYPNLYEEE